MKKIISTTLKILVFFLGWAILAGIITVPCEDPAIWRFFAELVPFLVLVVFTVIFLLLEKKEIRIPIKENLVKGTVVGTITGTIWIAVAAGVLMASRQLIITDQETVHILWLWILSALINVVMQELLIRGYMYQLLKKKFNLPAAVIFTTALFTLLHGGAFEAGVIPVLNVITMYLFTTALYESEKTLLAPIMAHAVWNVVGALFLGGVGLASDYPHLLTLQPSANTLLSGGTYKIEASIVTLFLNVALMVIFTYSSYTCRQDSPCSPKSRRTVRS